MPVCPAAAAGAAAAAPRHRDPDLAPDAAARPAAAGSPALGLALAGDAVADWDLWHLARCLHGRGARAHLLVPPGPWSALAWSHRIPATVVAHPAWPPAAGPAPAAASSLGHALAAGGLGLVLAQAPAQAQAAIEVLRRAPTLGCRVGWWVAAAELEPEDADLASAVDLALPRDAAAAAALRALGAAPPPELAWTLGPAIEVIGRWRPPLRGLAARPPRVAWVAGDRVLADLSATARALAAAGGDLGGASLVAFAAGPPWLPPALGPAGAAWGGDLSALMRAPAEFALALLPARLSQAPDLLGDLMAAGVACLAVDDPGSRSLAGAGGAARLPADDPLCLARALSGLASPAARRRQAERGRARVVETFSAPLVRAGWRRALTSLAAGELPSAAAGATSASPRR